MDDTHLIFTEEEKKAFLHAVEEALLYALEKQGLITAQEHVSATARLASRIGRRKA